MLSELCLFWHHMTQQQWLNPVPILDFWGLYAERGGGGGGVLACVVKEGMQCICLCFTKSWIALVESAHIFCGSVLFQLGFFFSSKRLYDIHFT